jgi:hypothetical protein
VIVDIRTYTLVPRKVSTYLDLFERFGLPVMQAHGMHLIGYFTSVIGPLNQVVHLWRYESLAEMEAVRARRDADPAWSEFLTKTEGLVASQDNRVMKPAAFSPEL